MIQLYDAGVYLLHGTEIVESGQEIRTAYRQRSFERRSGKKYHGISDP